jgi:hypothetical protein
MPHSIRRQSFENAGANDMTHRPPSRSKTRRKTLIIVVGIANVYDYLLCPKKSFKIAVANDTIFGHSGAVANFSNSFLSACLLKT